MSAEQEVAPELAEIEDEIIDHLINSPLFYSQSPIFQTLLGYFITRKHLTQSTLQGLTGLSAGKISKELNNLEEKGFITKSERSSILEPYVYTMESVESAFIDDAINVLNTSVKWEEELETIKKELIENEHQLGNLRGYEKINTFLDFLLPLLKFTKSKIKQTEQLKEIIKDQKKNH